MDEGRADIIMDSDPQQKEAEGDIEMLIEGVEPWPWTTTRVPF